MNRWPADYESAALPTELHRQINYLTTIMFQNQEKKNIETVIDESTIGKKCVNLSGFTETAKAYVVSKLYKKLKKPVLLVVSTKKEADVFLNSIGFFLKEFEQNIEYFPSYNSLPFNFIGYHNEIAAQRIRILYRLVTDSDICILIVLAETLTQMLIPKQQVCEFAEFIMVGEETDREKLVSKLITGGYLRTAIVEEPGDYCVRGGILDLFSPMYENPLRMEFFGDTVDSLRFFSPTTQRKLEDIKEAVVLPAREIILKKHDLKKLTERLKKQAGSLDIPSDSLSAIIEKVGQEGVFPGIESFMPLVYSKLDTIFKYLSKDTLFVLSETALLKNAVLDYTAKIKKNFETTLKEDCFCIEPEKQYLSWQELEKTFFKQKPVLLNSFVVHNLSERKQHGTEVVNFNVKGNELIRIHQKNIDNKDKLFLPLVNWISENRKNRSRILILCATKLQAERLRSLLKLYDIETLIIGEYKEADQTGIYICLSHIKKGFVWEAEFLSIVTEDEIFGTKGRRIAIKKREPGVSTQIFDFEDLKDGDFIVHADHGIGQYKGLVKLKFNGTFNDYILLNYYGDDKLYLPVERMNLAKKYMGVDSIVPVLDKLGSKSWDRVKSRAKKVVRKMANELLNLYASRKVKKGYEFGAVDSYFMEFEAGFPYEETKDQLKAIDDVLYDMQKTVPMDRLVCGDVGYGKTEVALRASFKAVSDNKQVAILVPTTVLAEQHFKTFTSRFKDYPVRIECLNRFRSVSKQRLIVNDLNAGLVDIVIGTHRLLQKDIKFKDIGLIVIDEEQRFGVTHKEKLKKIKETVDCLALTATPIPRTLHMSLMGLRDISLIATPPEQRHAILTYISEFNEVVIADAVKKELLRSGQIFFIHNNISTIFKLAKSLHKIVPECRIDVAHGRLGEDALEKVMLKFNNREIDMLVCTTIVESGLDIPAANTIFVNRADKFGLSQIYQLRGRVGRADEQAYAYLFIPKDSNIGEKAQKRLKVLMEHSDLGSGFKIAMSDLQIRGGGAVLGASQSGHIAAVGYDMFLKLMEDTINELKGKPMQYDLEPEINICLSAYISQEYIKDIDQRLSAYRRLVKMEDIGDISLFKEELIDRYGRFPDETGNLLLKIMLKILSVKAGVVKLDFLEKYLKLQFSDAHQKTPLGIINVIDSDPDNLRITKDNLLIANLPKKTAKQNFIFVKKILKSIAVNTNG